MSIKTFTVDHEADGVSLVSHFYIDDAFSGPRPGVVVFPEAFGLSDHAKGRARRLAELGYAALASDLHGDGLIMSDLADVMGVIGPLMEAPQRTRERAGSALQALAAQADVDGGRLAAIGYCFGGTMALELARGGAEVRGVAGFHSGLGTAAPQDAKNIKGKVLVCIGADDPGIPPEQRAAFETEMREGGVDWRMHLYGGVVHSFTNPEADDRGMPEFLRYDAGADARSWGELQAFLTEIFP